jgi:hypothetical protein
MGENNNRREFIKKAITVAGVSLCGCGLASLSGCDLEYIEEKYPIVYSRIREYTIDIFKIPELSVKDGIVSRSFGKILSGRQVLILRKDIGSESDFIVFSSICPHGGGEILPPQVPGLNYVCAEHYSVPLQN